jgi:diguanylate cyclase
MGNLGSVLPVGCRRENRVGRTPDGGSTLADPRLPALVWPFGPFSDLALRVHEFTVQGRNAEALRFSGEAERLAAALGDDRTVAMIMQGRMYALTGLGRLPEALAVGEALLRLHAAMGPRTSEAKTLADTAEILIKLGRLDEGLHCLARATALLDLAPEGSFRYVSAMSSVCDAARAAELYELADECARVAVDAFGPESRHRAAAELQRAELLLEWGIRLEQIGRVEDANLQFSGSMSLLSYWAQVYRDAPLANALLALVLAKSGRTDDALRLVGEVLVPMRAAGQFNEARLVHFAYGVALCARGDPRGARREFIAADELAVQPWQRLIFQYELASLAADEHPCEATQTMMTALRGQVGHLWQLRLERRLMLQQARRRVELEAARASADRAAASDALTGLGNRRLFDRHIDSVKGLVVLLLVDVDRFKGINDRYSHGVGDRVLREVAAVLRAHCRQDDVAIRFGGDEFALFMRTDLATAARIGERIRQVIAARDWSDLAAGLRVTLSMGVAALADGMTGHDLFETADRHLYAAKRGGRDRVAA